MQSQDQGLAANTICCWAWSTRKPRLKMQDILSPPTLVCFVGVVLPFQRGPDSVSLSKIISAGACETRSRTKGEGVKANQLTTRTWASQGHELQSIIISWGSCGLMLPTAPPIRPSHCPVACPQNQLEL